MSPMSPRLLRPRATGFSPTQIAGLAAWMDASDSATVTASGSAVSGWTNKAGATAATQGTAASRPTYQQSAVNGRNAIRFDGTNDSLQIASLTLPTYITAFVVSSTTGSGATLKFWFEHGANVNTSDGMFFNGTYSGAWAVRRSTTHDGPNSIAGTDWIGTGWAIAGLTYDGVGTIYRNGSLVSNATANGTARSNSDVTAALNIGSRNQSSLFLTGDIGEILIYNSPLSTSNRQRVEGYLAWKWGLQATLPYDHPYAASFPGYGTQATPTDADALAYLSAVRTADGGTGVEVGVANAVDSFVKGCKSDGIWSAIKASCILAGARTLSGALVPLAGTAPTNNGFVAADYNRKTGLIGDASTKWLDTNRNNNADPQDSKHLAVWRTAAASNDAGLFGSNGTSTGDSHIYTGFGSFNFRNNAATSATQLLTLMTGEGFLGTSRAAADSFSYRIGTTSYTAAVASQAPRSANLRVFETGTRTNARLAFYSAGESLNLASLGTRVARLMAEAQYNLNTGLSGSSYATETLAYINAGYAAGGTLA